MNNDLPEIIKQIRFDQWNLRLYVAGKSPRSLTAIANLQKVCEEYLNGQFEIEIIDLVEHPHIARRDQIIAIPTVVRKTPLPLKQIFGDLSNYEKLVRGLELEMLNHYKK